MEENIPNTKCEMGVQTSIDLENALHLQIRSLKQQVNKLKTEVRKLKTENRRIQSIKIGLKKCFTDGQIRKLEKVNKRVVWSSRDIGSAITLYSAGPRSYRYLYRTGHPLPAASTLRKWTAKLKLKPGILSPVLNLIKDLDFTEWERLCILSFDEMKIRSVYEYDKANDEIMSPYKYVQVVMMRGLFKSWKQPIFYKFDSPMTPDVLKHIIRVLEDINFTVVAVTSDLGATNSALRKNLNIDEQNPFFVHPSNEDKKIFMFADVPHLIKLLRNHFIDSGFNLNGKHITAQPISEILNIEKSDVKICHKITPVHLEVAQAARQKVKFAVQLFSHSVASCIRWCVALGKCNSPNSLECAELIKTTNDWFDIFNSKLLSSDSRCTKKAYGLKLEEQQKILNQMTELIKNLRVYDKKKHYFLFKKELLSIILPSDSF